MFGKLTLSAIPFDQPIIMGAGALMAIIVLATFGEVACAVPGRDGTGTTELTAILSGTDSQVFAGRVVRGMNLSFITVEVTLQEWLADAEELAKRA